MAAKKIVCLGGGSLYFPRALGDLVAREDLAGSEIVLYDLDVEKSELMAAMGRRLADEAGTHFTIRAAAELAEAVDGADFAISSIGGSGAEITPGVYGSWYHAADTYIPAKYGIYQVVGDTAGPAGMMMGLRAVNAYIHICREMERRCPNAILFNHSNPMAVICRALNKHTSIKIVGICHGVQATVHQAAKMLGLPADELDCVWIGTNHYYWILSVAHRGVDLTDKVMAAGHELGAKGTDNLCHRMSRIYGTKFGFPGAGHIAEFHSWATRLPAFRELPYDLPKDAKWHGFDPEQPMPQRTLPTPEARAQFLKDYADILDHTKLPEGIDYVSEEGIAAMTSAIAHGRREVFIVNVPNRGAISNLPPDALVEIEGVTDSTGVRGVVVGQCPPVLKGILEKRFAWQELVVDAAVTGDRGLALQALMLDEMAIPPDAAEDMLDELLDASRDLLPQFFGRE